MTLIEGNSPKNTSAKGKHIYPNIRWPHPQKNKISVRKFHTLSTQSLLDSIYFTNQCHYLHHQSQCLHLTHTFSLTSSHSSLSFCNTGSLVPSTVKDIQHYLTFRLACNLLVSKTLSPIIALYKTQFRDLLLMNATA